MIVTAARAADMPATIERVKRSIVAVGTFQKTRSPAFVFRGTGFVVGHGRLVATNAHVLPDGALSPNEVLVVLASSAGEVRPREARVHTVDAAHDVAVLAVEGAPFPALELQDSTEVREGQFYAFTGFPIGNVLGFAPVTHRGMISAVTPIAIPAPNSRPLDSRTVARIRSGVFPVFQLDATAYPGNSGSPLYDMETGRVVAVVNMVFVKGTREAALSQPSGIAFAIPSRHLKDLLDRTR